MKKINNIILNGIERSGSTAIAKTLAEHPDVELIFQPFNSGNIRKHMNQVMDDTIADTSDIEFFSGLEKNKLVKSYIKSPWFEKLSTTTDFIEGRLHVIKTTINHFTMEWVRKNFPDLEIWGIWREPLDVLASISRNNYFRQWFGGAAEQLLNTVRQRDYLDKAFGGFGGLLDTDDKKTAFIIAVRSYYFFYHLDDGKIINYEKFKENAQSGLAPVLDYFKLDEFIFPDLSRDDLNYTGEGFAPGRSHRQVISEEDLESAGRIFQPLNQLVKDRFGIHAMPE